MTTTPRTRLVEYQIHNYPLLDVRNDVVAGRVAQGWTYVHRSVGAADGLYTSRGGSVQALDNDELLMAFTWGAAHAASANNPLVPRVVQITRDKRVRFEATVNASVDGVRYLRFFRMDLYQGY